MIRRFTEPKLVAATHNDGKLEEIRHLLRNRPVEVVSAKELGLAIPDETGDSFVGNARIKAHAAASASGLPALADDSGIEVDALGGRPGVHTADWAETVHGRDFALAMTRTWDELEAVAAPCPRTARFLCTLVLTWPDGHDEVFRGRIEGEIVWPMRGDQGHGYDPIFLPEGHDVTFGEMDRWQKNAISHRGDAFAKLKAACFD
jgi:XTP/dITP diphosphohydrolase